MKDLANLCCPLCKGGFSITDHLSCSHCNKSYPLAEGIPIMLSDLNSVDDEQNLAAEKEFYENMFAGVKNVEDGHCIVYGRERIYDFMDSVERGTLLEVGCGGGHHSVNLAAKGFQVTSIDISVNGLKAAKRLAEHEKKDITFICGDIKRLPFKDKQFDICFCSLILHHFTALDNIIKELSRVTKKYFIAFEVNALDPISFLRFNVLNPVFGISNISKNQRALFPSNLEKKLFDNGFKDVIIQFDDIHEYLGKAPDSMKAKMISFYLKVMRLLPNKYSKNKFFLRAVR